MRILSVFLVVLGPVASAVGQTVPATPSNGGTAIGTYNNTNGTWSCTLTWQDNANNEGGFDVYQIINNEPISILGGSYLPKDVESIQLSGLGAPSRTYTFAVRAGRGDGAGGILWSGYLVLPSITTPGFQRFGFQGYAGFPLGAVLDINQRGLVSSSSVTGMPGWMSYSGLTQSFSGTPPSAGNWPMEVTINYAGGATYVRTVTARVLAAPSGPVATQVLPGLVMLPGGVVRTMDLGGYFTDPDVTAAARLSTTKGDVDIILYPEATPATVANFLAYVNAAGVGGYGGALFHRSVPSFVIQGGGYRPIGGKAFESVTDLPPVVNEPGLENVEGTVSMAKVGGNPDSATNEFFFSLADNRGNLDYQNEGFSVFGRLTPAGQAVADAIEALPIGDYRGDVSITVDGFSAPSLFEDTPMDAATAPAVMDQSKLVTMTAARELAAEEFLSFEVIGNTNPGLVSVWVNGTQMMVSAPGGGTGTAEVTVEARDLDGNTLSGVVAVAVERTFTAWAASEGLKGSDADVLANPEGDELRNLAEYGFLGDPLLVEKSPVVAVVREEGGADYLAVRFPALAGSFTDVRYRVEASAHPDGPWALIWTSDEIPSPLAQIDSLGNNREITVRDSQPLGTGPRFFRVVVEYLP